MEESILVNSGADPWVIKSDGFYYYCRVDKNDSFITVSKSLTLAGIGAADPVIVWHPSTYRGFERISKELWAPELHTINSKWYIYFSADDGKNESHRVYALEAETSDPQGKYVFKGPIASVDDHWAIDGTVLQHKRKLYFIWSGWEGLENVAQNLYIAKMSNPWTISSPRVCISQPQYAWEHSIDPPINEAPEVLHHGQQVHIIYSASSTLTDDYCLGRLALTGEDVMDPDSWGKAPQPVFKRTPEIIAPGHASFTKSLDNSEDWIVYHTARYSGSGLDRQVRAKRFTWHEDGSPDFCSLE